MKNFVLIFLLTACADPVTVYRPVRVEVPVAAAQPAMIEKPDFALGHLAPNDNLADKTKAALIELDQRKAYEAALISQLNLCQ